MILCALVARAPGSHRERNSRAACPIGATFGLPPGFPECPLRKGFRFSALLACSCDYLKPLFQPLFSVVRLY